MSFNEVVAHLKQDDVERELGRMLREFRSAVAPTDARSDTVQQSSRPRAVGNEMERWVLGFLRGAGNR